VEPPFHQSWNWQFQVPQRHLLVVVFLTAMQQGYLGMHENNDKWDDFSEAFEAETHEIDKRQLADLNNTINYDALDEAAKLSYRLFEYGLKQSIDAYQYRDHDYPVNQMFGVQSWIPSFLINVHQVNDTSDAEAYVIRLNGLPDIMKEVVADLKQKEEKGVIAPNFALEKGIVQAQNILKGKPFDESEEDNAILSDFKRKVEALSLDKAQQIKLIENAQKALLESFKPAYESLIAALAAQQPKAVANGAWSLPDGTAYYQFSLQQMTTTNMTPDEIHELGLSEVKRIHEEMHEIMKKVGFEGDLKAFFKHLQDREDMYYPDSDEGRAAALKDATKLIEDFKPQLDKLFKTKPKADVIVKAVEPFRSSAGKAFYNQPAPDGSRPGTYYVNLTNLKSLPKWEMAALAYHEGIPGHHMQIAIAQELEGLPKFRRFGANYTAYVEGWGLYSEYLPTEIGMYQDPYDDFGRLSMELLRACRLVADSGIHHKKWTREEAIKFMLDSLPVTEASASRSVERYFVMPGQATAYKIGMLKFQALQQKARAALGDGFDIREYHDVALTNGPLPLEILEEQVDQWIASTDG
ncbi:MAG: DUF885 domain-containing protein, partial [Pseudomonadota bacterium]